MKYPNNIKKETINYANRGMHLENDLNATNEYYLLNDIALIYKKPTPITIMNVDYKAGINGIITKAYFKAPSTTDYNGLYRGKYIDFEAKVTSSKTSFPLSNIHKHQLIHLKKVLDHKGIAFLIINFSSYDETYFLKAEDVFEHLANNEKKSLPYSLFKEKGYLIKMKYNPRLDYLKVVDELYFKEGETK
jgi:recombination protein U